MVAGPPCRRPQAAVRLQFRLQKQATGQYVRLLYQDDDKRQRVQSASWHSIRRERSGRRQRDSPGRAKLTRLLEDCRGPTPDDYKPNRTGSAPYCPRNTFRKRFRRKDMQPSSEMLLPPLDLCHRPNIRLPRRKDKVRASNHKRGHKDRRSPIEARGCHGSRLRPETPEESPEAV